MIQTISSFLSGDNGQTMYWVCALLGSVYYGISGLLYLFGFGGVSDTPDGLDMDADGSIDLPHADTGFLDFKLLSLKAIFAFIMMFGWGGVVFGRDNGFGGLAGAFACGLVTMIITAFVITFILKLQQNGSKSISVLVGHTGSVYLSIPAGRNGFGKVIIGSGDDTREVQAVCDEALPTGTAVRVVSCVDGRKVVVERVQ